MARLSSKLGQYSRFLWYTKVWWMDVQKCSLLFARKTLRKFSSVGPSTIQGHLVKLKNYKFSQELHLGNDVKEVDTDQALF